MSHPRFSTNVRFRHRILRFLVVPLGRLAPRLAARLLERLFSTPPRRPLDAAEREWGAGGRSERLLVGERSVVVTTWGTPGPVALLAHGWGGRGVQLGAFVRPLLDAGFQVVAFDAPAHGATAGRRTNLLELAAALAAVARRYPPRAVVAHSVGAVAATLAMADGLRPERAVFLAPADDPWTFLERAASHLGLSRAIAQRVRSDLERRFALAPIQLVASQRAPGLGTALLAFHDATDREVAHADGARLVAAWPGARLETTRGLGHRRILTDPEVVAAAVEFLGRPAVPLTASAELRLVAHHDP